MKWLKDIFDDNDKENCCKTFEIKFKFKENKWFNFYNDMILYLKDIIDKESKYIYENNKVKKIYYFDVYEYDFGYNNYGNVRKLDIEKINKEL